MSLAIDSSTKSIQYWGEQQDNINYETVWSLWECKDINQSMFKNKSYRVFYRFILSDATISEMMNDEAWVEVSSFTAGGTVLDFWRAAESCYQQAKQYGDWHKFIEDFEIQDNGSFELVMGS